MYQANTELKIKNEYFATRCEVCHKADAFDPITNYCTRCQYVNVEPPIVNEKTIKRGSYIRYLILNISITTLSYLALQLFHPILVREKITLFFLPISIITIFPFLFNYRFLVNKATVLRQIIVFYITFLTTLIVYGVYLGFFLGWSEPFNNPVGLIFTGLFFSVMFGHIFGFPTLVFMIFINNLLKKFLFGEQKIEPKKFVIRI